MKTRRIPTRRFGRTGLRMPVLTCGAMRYMHGWKDAEWSEISDACQQNLEDTIRYGLKHGISHIETARGYGTSERQLGKLLPRLPRNKIIVQTKVGPKEDVQAFIRSFHVSMERLQLDYVDLLGIHGINDRQALEWTLRRNGCLAAARRFQKQGRCRYIGFSTHAPADLIIETVNTDAFDYVNLHYYFVNPTILPAVYAARERDMGVLIISPNDKGGKLYTPPRKMTRLCAPLSPMAFNDCFTLQQEGVHTLSIGAAKPSDFDEHIRAMRRLDDRALIGDIADRLHGEMARVLGRGWAEHWMEGIPPWEDLPGQINVHEILRLWTFAKSLGLKDFGNMRYNLLGNGGSWFPGYMAKRFSEKQMLDALKHHPYAGRIPAILREAHRMFYEKPKKRLSQS